MTAVRASLRRRRRGHGEALVLQGHGDEVGDRPLVVDDEDADRRPLLRSCPHHRQRKLGICSEDHPSPLGGQALMTTGVPIGVHENAHCITDLGVCTQPWLAACRLSSPPGPYELDDSHGASWMK